MEKAINQILLDEQVGGKGRHFSTRFLQAGLVKYSFGVCLLEKETIDKFIYNFVGCPVIINHKDVTNESAKDDRVGVISRVWFNERDGWYWGEGVIFEQEALDLIDKGYNVSCQYEISEYSTNGGIHNGNDYDKVILNGKPEHLAIVKNPRYENAMIAVNAMEIDEMDLEAINGGEGSGDFDHAGRPGKVGGSEPAGTGRKGKYDNKDGTTTTTKQAEKKDKKESLTKKRTKEDIEKELTELKSKIRQYRGGGDETYRKMRSDYRRLLDELEKADKQEGGKDKYHDFMKSKINDSWYKNAKIDYGVEGKLLDTSLKDDTLTITWEEKEPDKEKKTYKMNIPYASDYTNQQLYDIWSAQDYEAEEITTKKEEKPKKQEEAKKNNQKYYKEEMAKVTSNRFNKLFQGGSIEDNQFRTTKKISDKEQITFDKKRNQVIFYKQGDLSESKDYNAPKGTVGMLETFRTDNYNKLVDYLINERKEEYRLEASKQEPKKQEATQLKLKLQNDIMQAINELKETDMFKNLFRKRSKTMDREEMKDLFMECLTDLTASNEKEVIEDEEVKEEVAENKCKNKEDDLDYKKLYNELKAKVDAKEKEDAETAKAKNSIEEQKEMLLSGKVETKVDFITQSRARELGKELF